MALAAAMFIRLVAGTVYSAAAMSGDGASRTLCPDSAATAHAVRTPRFALSGLHVGLGAGNAPVEGVGWRSSLADAGFGLCGLPQWRFGLTTTTYSGVPNLALDPHPLRVRVRELGLDVQRTWFRSSLVHPFAELAAGSITTSYQYSADLGQRDDGVSGGLFVTPGFGFEGNLADHLTAQVVSGYQVVTGLTTPGLNRRGIEGIVMAARIRFGVF